MRALIWRFYDDLKAYRAEPTARRRGELRDASTASSADAPASSRSTACSQRLHANKPELLMVLDRPEIPLHTNGSERDIRRHVTKRKVSGGTRSAGGRDCRDAFLGLMRTGAKLGIAFWDYLGSRLRVPAQPVIPDLPDLIRCRSESLSRLHPRAPAVLPLLRLWRKRGKTAGGG